MKLVPVALLLPAAFMLMAPARAHAASFIDPAMIDAEVARFTGMPQGTTGGAAQPADRRLKLAACANPLSLGWYSGRRDTVLVQCPDAGGWRLFVPVLQGAAGAADGPAVLRGEAVTIAVAGPGFSVSQPGEAMEAGQVGGWIRVKTAASGTQPMRARIVRPGLVAVSLDDE
ncbi:MAG TPA: flagella basal body P-ring formation protein FlgA [Novosphingobium sp.]|nr:flagella basal body P-ring formation protein FlgA [Novosphingobium sp.]